MSGQSAFLVMVVASMVSLLLSLACGRRRPERRGIARGVLFATLDARAVRMQALHVDTELEGFVDKEAAVARRVGRHNASEPRAGSTRAGDLVLIGGVVNFTYAALVIHALAHAESRLTSWVDGWVRMSRAALSPAYLLAGRPDCGGTAHAAFVDRAWAFDVHLVTINLLLVAILFALSRASWPAWAGQLRPASRVGDAADGSHAADLEEGFGTVLWGAIGALWWMLLQNDLFDTAPHCASLRPWLLFREPLLATCVHGLACLAAALNRARTV